MLYRILGNVSDYTKFLLTIKYNFRDNKVDLQNYIKYHQKLWSVVIINLRRYIFRMFLFSENIGNKNYRKG